MPDATVRSMVFNALCCLSDFRPDLARKIRKASQRGIGYSVSAELRRLLFDVLEEVPQASPKQARMYAVEWASKR